MSNYEDDPYLYLEERDSPKARKFALTANQMCLSALGDPSTSSSSTYPKILNFLEADERIPLVVKMGTNESGEDLLYNFWKDASHPRGIWRTTTLSSYEDQNTEWNTILDLDRLAEQEKIPWVWRGSRVLPKSRDPWSENGGRVTRALISLSRDGSDKVSVREFDLLKSEFVIQDSFNLPEGKTRVSYKSRDILYVISDIGRPQLTKSGNPITIREWTRGTDLSDAPVVFEGEESDIGVSAYIDDQRLRGGDIFEVHKRTMGLKMSKYFVRKVKYEHLLAKDDPVRTASGEASTFKELQVPHDANIDFAGNLLIITLGSEWSPIPGKTFSAGAIIYVNSHKFIKYGSTDRIYHALYKPSERTSCESYCMTKKFLILSIMDNVKSKLEFYKFEKDANKLRLIGMDKYPQIRVNHVRPVDPYKNDEFWLTTNGYTEPSALWLADARKLDSKDKKVIRKTGSEGYMVRKLKALPHQFDSSDLHVIQKLAPSKDGTAIPYFMVMKKGTLLDKNNPTLLYAHGGFGVTLSPHYNGATGLAWLERGGVYVEANIRGGGEFGEDWHQSATRDLRYKSYEDFIGVAEDLIASRICKPKTLAIRGGLNGGLLVANAYVSRPDLFGAVHCIFPLLDMKRFKTMSSTASCIEEFGDPDTKDWEKFLKKFSPYHNIDETNKKQPPILFTACNTDQRAHPGHARKMVKKLWDLDKGKKWPAYYYEILDAASDSFGYSKQYAFITSLGFDFLFKILSKNAEKERRKSLTN